MKNPRITLEQWATFKAVVDEGSFSKAAEVLNKSQSSVSYIIGKMEEQLPIPVLELQGRKAELTEAGKLLYRRAKRLLEEAVGVEQSAEYLASGWEPLVRIAVDAIVPLEPVMCGLEAFSQISSETRIKLEETSLSGTDEALLERRVELALMPRVPPGFLGDLVTEISMIPVAHKSHPLVNLDHRISPAELSQHRQIVVSDSGIKREQNVGWLGAEKRWTVSHFASSIKVIKHGLGFAFVPQAFVQTELNTGELCQLNLESGQLRKIPLYLVTASQDHSGPATLAVKQALLESFKSRCND